MIANKQYRSCLAKQKVVTKSASHTKKRVVFADDSGKPLTQIRIITETPYKVPSLFLQKNSEKTKKTWKFSTELCKYLNKKKKSKKVVGLNSANIDNSGKHMNGVVKVKNFQCTKEVFVRYSTDEWKTQTDLDCTLVHDGISDDVRASYCLFEMFSFKLPLPTSANNLKFSIGYRHDGKEDWDNNQNFALIYE